MYGLLRRMAAPAFDNKADEVLRPKSTRLNDETYSFHVIPKIFNLFC